MEMKNIGETAPVHWDVMEPNSVVGWDGCGGERTMGGR